MRSEPRSKGFWVPTVGSLFVFLFSCLVFAVTCSVITLPPAWRTFEFCQYAEIGRNLALEGRYDTRLVEPMALAAIDRDSRHREAERWPVVNRYPLPCLVIAALMKMFGPTDLVAAWSNGIAISLLAALAYALASRWYGKTWGAILAVLLLANPAFYGEFVLIGTPDIWFAVLFLAHLAVWARFDPRASSSTAWGWAGALALLGGLSYLARFNATLFIGFEILALVCWKRWREASLLALVMFAFSTPLMLYNWSWFHRLSMSVYSSWNLLDDINAYQVEPWLYYQVPDLTSMLAAHLDGFSEKFTSNLFEVVPARIWSLWRMEPLLVLALLSPLLIRRPGPVRRLAYWSVGFFVLQLIIFSAMRLELESRTSPHHGRYFFWFATPALLLSVAVLKQLSDWKRPFRWLAALVVIAQLAGSGWSWAQLVPAHRSGTNLGQDPIRRMLTDAVPPGKVIASNQPQITAWFCGLRSISLPANPEELARLNEQSPTPVDYLLIDLNYNCIDLDQRWTPFVNRDPRIPSDWIPEVLRDYEYMIPARNTRPVLYVVLRRKVSPPSQWEEDFNRSNVQ